MTTWCFCHLREALHRYHGCIWLFLEHRIPPPAYLIAYLVRPSTFIASVESHQYSIAPKYNSIQPQFHQDVPLHHQICTASPCRSASCLERSATWSVHSPSKAAYRVPIRCNIDIKQYRLVRHDEYRQAYRSATQRAAFISSGIDR